MLRAIARLRTPLRSLPKPTPLFPFSPPLPLFSPALPSTPSSSAPLPAASFSSSRRSREETDQNEIPAGSVSIFGRDPTRPPRLFVVQPRLRPDSLLKSKLAEALNLANSLEEPRDGFFEEEFSAKERPPHVVVQNPAARSQRMHSDKYFGQGTVENVKCHLTAFETENNIDAVFINAILSGIQQRNLEVAWGKPVLDRVGLIIEIFNAHAETKEAKLQSELAALVYKRSRLVRVRGSGGRLTFGGSGEAEVVSARGRASGGRGFISGAGETELQLQRRRIQERRTYLLSQIEEVRRTRALQRYARKRHGSSYGHSLATVAVVGYTNAGKSTLVSALSESYVYSDDRLFATVDPRLRSVILPSGKKVLLSDTVGFISDLPVQLVEAFHATLEEVVEADLLVHVLDSSSPDLDEQRETVLQVLKQIGVSDEKIQNMIEVWNKIDLLENNGEAEDFHEEEESTGEDTEKWQEEDMDSDGSSGELIDAEDDECDDHQTSELSQEETMDGADDMDSSGNTDFSDVPSELPSEENLKNFDVQKDDDCLVEWNNKKDTKESHETWATNRVKISAVTGVGLQELLYLLDKKLNSDKSSEQNTFGPYDRKWRPSYSADVEKATEQ
ncbi:GTP-binding protein At3g49725, chloroplastic-like isoform X2 [Zingiber officinale]|nr:GTP-binding protein At3g49725, chloroplastic-like isoform X1 [Zingiber officinale]XP_042389618.1 GTP-binding protein At3g49725, chloroplastic-like isoform X2 [Zingiber officinale]